MITAVIDTHAAIWYLSNDIRLSSAADNWIEQSVQAGDQIAISSITFIEMVYLVEKGRIPAQRFTQLASELTSSESIFIEISVTLVIARALSNVEFAKVPDMPDRIVAATALHLGLPIISRDRKIPLSGLRTIW